MTHTTEQERAEFEARFKHLDLTKEPDAWGAPRYKHDAISLAWDTWQAARRAPAAPVPQGWKLVPISPTQEQLRAGYWSGGGEIRLHEEWARKESYERMVQNAPMTSPAAAPQPPEAAQSNSAEFDGIKPDAFQTEGGCPVSNAETVAIAALEKVLRAIQRHLPPERIGERETIAEIISIVDPWPLGNLPAPWKDHRTAALVNELRDCAAKYGQTQQLRERIAYIVAPLCAQLKAAEQAAVNQQLTTETAPVQLPENLREGEPYDNPAFEALARALGVWGTAQSAVCAQFWIAAKEQST